ncbi:MAG: hypothetical protein ACLQF0_05410 [Dissulfurispiraceae bacterium]
MSFYDKVYFFVIGFGNYTLYGMYVCQIIAPIILLFILYRSRQVSSGPLKVLAMIICVILYNFHWIVSKFSGG